MERLLFNSSMPRSGSELLQVLLHQNPRIYGSVTSPLLEYQFAARGNYELPEVKSQEPVVMQKAFISMCRGMAHSYYSEITQRPIVIDKNRGWIHYYEWVDQWNPNPKMVCMVRDLRSVVASMEKIWRVNRHRPTGPDNPAALAGMTVPQRAEHWLNTQPIGLAVVRTLDTFRRNLDKEICFIRYEDLCAAPQATMNKVYDYIGEPHFMHDFVNIQKQVFEDDSHFGVYGNHSVSAKLQAPAANFKEILGVDVCAQIRSTFAGFFDTFGY